MTPALTYAGAAVYDDFLTEELAHGIWDLMNELPYARSDSQQWIKVWTLADGSILRSPPWMARAPDWRLVFTSQVSDQALVRPPEVLVAFLARLRELLAVHQGLPEIRRILLIPYVWPPKSSISWHHDGGSDHPDTRARVGAFTFYVHKTWNAEWGGELLLSDVPADFRQRAFDNTEVSEAIIGKGHGVWVTPRPNRIVVNPTSMYHKVGKTTDAASPRLSIQGFLYSS